MNVSDNKSTTSSIPPSFFDQQNVAVEELPYGSGVPLGIVQVTHPALSLGGAYGTWGDPYDNHSLPRYVESRLGAPLAKDEVLDLTPLGFEWRHHIEDLDDEDHYSVEIEVGVRLLKNAAQACGWEPSEVQGVLIGCSGPIALDYTVQIARAAGIPENVLKVSIHKACDSSMSGLHVTLNPNLPANRVGGRNIAEELRGKKVLVGGIEGLSRFIRWSHDSFAMQIFGNGAGVIGLIPGENMKFLVGKTHEAFDHSGTLAVRMYYPHSRKNKDNGLMEEVQQAGENYIRLAGFMHEPEGGVPLSMASPMGMVKLFVRTGVEVVQDIYSAYQAYVEEQGLGEKQFSTAVVHHANYKINQLKKKSLAKLGIDLPMPWVLSEFGNVSAASNMIAFLRQLPDMKANDHILLYGFGAGTYYDAVAVELNTLSN
jgi:3-oxoacyl-[acyl-carrier-protein] synthase III